MNLLHLRESKGCRKGLEGILDAELVLGRDRDFMCHDHVCSLS